MLVSGRQIAAARALVGWKQIDLAKAASVHENSVLTCEKAEPLNTKAETCQRIEKALREAGVDFIAKPSIGVRFMPDPQDAADAEADGAESVTAGINAADEIEAEKRRLKYSGWGGRLRRNSKRAGKPEFIGFKSGRDGSGEQIPI